MGALSLSGLLALRGTLLAGSRMPALRLAACGLSATATTLGPLVGIRIGLAWLAMALMATGMRSRTAALRLATALGILGLSRSGR